MYKIISISHNWIATGDEKGCVKVTAFVLSKIFYWHF